MPIRVLVAEDHAIVRQGIRLILETQPDFEVVGEATTGREAVAAAKELQPDVVCMDISMPDMDGMAATRGIQQCCPDVKVLALTVHESDEYFFEMLRAGASGYVLKGAASAELITALRDVARGAAFLQPSLARRLVDDFVSRTGQAADDPYHGLSPREREVLLLVGEGLANAQIADRLTISLSTVQTHTSHILEKLGLSNRVELIKYAIREGLIDIEK